MMTATSRRTQPILISAALLLMFAVGACSSGGGGGGSSVSTFSAPNCASGITSDDIDADVPDWIKNNFTCIAASLSGSNVVIKTHSLPPYTSAYYDPDGTYGSRYTSSLPTNHSTNPNTISSQEMTFTIPATPLTDPGDFTATFTEHLADTAGVAVDGVAIFNAFAASPDLLANEAWTLDSNWGHPTNKGQYHYHVEPTQISNNDEALIGIALDGLPIYGAKDQANRGSCGGTPCIPTLSDADHDLSDDVGANFHCHATDEFTSGVCHYHVLTTYSENTTQTIGPVASGTSTSLRYMVKYFAGPKGSYSLSNASVPMFRGNRAAALLATAAWCGPGGP